MAGSSFGKIFKITTWGESHGPALGVVIDGCPAGIKLSEEDIQPFLNRRRPGQSNITSLRNESDKAEILSGVFEGKTTGTPISIMIKNEDHCSDNYNDLEETYRPGHADYTFDKKYGFRDYRGGGRASGRETASRVAAGAVASIILDKMGIKVSAYTKSIGNISISNIDLNEINNNVLYMPDKNAADKAIELIEQKKSECDSIGGVIECIVNGMPGGIGEPVFDKLDANLAKAVMSIGSVKGIEIGSGFDVSKMSGSENNDIFINDNGIKKETNNSGGILGGISDGSQIILKAAIKPTPSIGKIQKTVDKNGNEIDIKIKGRHDPVIVPRACVVVESMVAITILDAIFEHMTNKLD